MKPTLPITLYPQIREGSTPVNQLHLTALISGASIFALFTLYFGKKED